MQPVRFLVDPRDPRAPSQEIWDRLTEAERARIVAALPSEPPRAAPPEGDRHRIPKSRALEALDEYYRRIRRRIYLSSELPVYYPDEPMFAPDLLVVTDVEPHERQSWVVSHERKGLDLVLEIHVSGDRRKDFEDNVARYSRLAITEYFAFDATRARLAGWRLSDTRSQTYEPIVPQAGRWRSRVLELDLSLEQGQLRFFYGTAPLLDARELIGRLSTMVDDAIQRAEQEAQRAEQETQRADRLAARLRELGIDPEKPD